MGTGYFYCVGEKHAVYKCYLKRVLIEFFSTQTGIQMQVWNKGARVKRTFTPFKHTFVLVLYYSLVHLKSGNKGGIVLRVDNNVAKFNTVLLAGDYPRLFAMFGNFKSKTRG